jgi:phosphoribosylformylglycinamidine synthase
MKVGVIVFPGSNCDHDVEHLFGGVLECKVVPIWHRDSDIQGVDMVIVPGGFSYGDYLRAGALAKLSPVMKSVVRFAQAGGPVLGICNGFQILCECGLLPGVLLQNIERKFLSRFVHIRVESQNTPFTARAEIGSTIYCPIAHNEGNYFADADTVKLLQDNDQIVFRYCSPDGSVSDDSRTHNPNGSALSIAGICNEKRNVVGMMPHPERAVEASVGGVGGDQGMVLFSHLQSA